MIESDTMHYRPKRAYVEINLDNLLWNFDQLWRELKEKVAFIPVVKDCAYGCGAVAVTRAVEKKGVDLVAVANCSEARHLRKNGIELPILTLGKPTIDQLRWGAKENIVFTLNDITELTLWNSLELPLSVHINIDTGMGRMGISPEEFADNISLFSAQSRLSMAGIFSHFACADSKDKSSLLQQFDTFKHCLELCEIHGLGCPVRHVANSAAIMGGHRFGVTHARPGIALYGCKPDPSQDFGVPIKPVVSLKGQVVKIKRVSAGTPISYGWQYKAPKQTTIATVNIGYGAGLPRYLSNSGAILIGGTPYPICGRVTMDYTMVDIGKTREITLGDEAVALGEQGTNCISADQIAVQGNTIGYEVLCGLNYALDRVYREKGEITDIHSGSFF